MSLSENGNINDGGDNGSDNLGDDGNNGANGKR